MIRTGLLIRPYLLRIFFYLFFTFSIQSPCISNVLHTADYGWNSGTPDVWQKITIPLSGFINANLTDISIPFLICAQSNATFYVDMVSWGEIAEITPITPVTTEYAWDGWDQLKEVDIGGGILSQFTYNGDGTRVQKSVDSVVTKYLHDGMNVYKEYTGSDVIKAAYLQSLGLDQPVSMKDSYGDTYYYHTDLLGSVRAMTNSNGSVTQTYDYDVWGVLSFPSNRESSLVANPFGFTGRNDEVGETGLMYYRARYYDPEIGRFISQDPYSGGPDDARVSYGNSYFEQIHGKLTLYTAFRQPHRFNRYAYVNNNPAGFTDPTGMWSKDVHDMSIQLALEGGELSQNQIEIVKKSNNWFDRLTQLKSQSYMHSMFGKGQNFESEKAKLENFKQAKLKEIRESRAKRNAKGDTSVWSKKELKIFGQLQHPFVDEMCSVHGWTEWKPIKFFTNRDNYRKKHKTGDKKIDSKGYERNAKIISDLFKEASK